jgi:hypothetical protein
MYAIRDPIDNNGFLILSGYYAGNVLVQFFAPGRMHDVFSAFDSKYNVDIDL